jgi:hypothetical protein
MDAPAYFDGDVGQWHEPAHARGYAYERACCGHIIAVVEIPLAGCYLCLLDGQPYGFDNGGLGEIEEHFERRIRQMTAQSLLPWDGGERRNHERKRHNV